MKQTDDHNRGCGGHDYDRDRHVPTWTSNLAPSRGGGGHDYGRDRHVPTWTSNLAPSAPLKTRIAAYFGGCSLEYGHDRFLWSMT